MFPLFPLPGGGLVSLVFFLVPLFLVLFLLAFLLLFRRPFLLLFRRPLVGWPAPPLLRFPLLLLCCRSRRVLVLCIGFSCNCRFFSCKFFCGLLACLSRGLQIAVY
jgi:hypothetical protein